MAILWKEPRLHEIDSHQARLFLKRRALKDYAEYKPINRIWYEEHDDNKWWCASAFVAIAWAIAIWLSCR